MFDIVIILLAITIALTAGMVFVLLAILKQGRRIEQMARDTQDLAKIVDTRPSGPAGDTPRQLQKN